MLLFLLLPLGICGCLPDPEANQEANMNITCKAAYPDQKGEGDNRRIGDLLSFFGYQQKPSNVPKLQMDVRIINGTHTNRSEFPYQVALFADLDDELTYYCGAILASERYVITAAHCVTSPWNYSVRVGTVFRSRGGQVRDVESVVRHPSYDPNTNDFDVAVLRLAPPPLKLSHRLQPAVLASSEMDARPRSVAVASGWGTIDPKSVNLSESLVKVNVPILSTQECLQSYGAAITTRMLCAGYLDGRHDACQGDSGGPLSVDGKVVGIVSWGYGCALEGCPGVFTKMSSVREWIYQVSGV